MLEFHFLGFECKTLSLSCYLCLVDIVSFSPRYQLQLKKIKLPSLSLSVKEANTNYTNCARKSL